MNVTNKPGHQLDGTWIPVYEESEGMIIPKESFEKNRFMFEGENYTALHGRNVEIGKVIIYDNIMEYHVEEGFFKGKIVRAIYKLEGGTLTICFNLAANSDVPTDFTTKNNSQLLLVRFVRES